MARLYLIRHAATQPTSDAAATWPLSPRGEQGALLLAEHPCWQDVTRIVSSPEEKALATVRPASARHKLPLDIAADLRELQRSPAWTSQAEYEQTVAAVFAHPDRSIAGWEPASEVQKRVAATVAALVQAHPGETLALASHGLALTIWLAHIQGEPHPSLASWRTTPFAAVACIDLDRRVVIAPFRAVDP